jgi:putative nucleotidyltransferase with HDIG domain
MSSRLRSKRQFFIVSILLVILVGCIIVVNFLDVANRNRELMKQNINTIAQSIEPHLKSVDKLYYFLEMVIDTEAKPILEEMNSVYTKTRTIDFDLEQFKLDNNYLDLYIIDKNNTIVRSTDSSEIGLNFNDFEEMEEFHFELDYIREIKRYYSPRIMIGTISDTIRKYVYLASDDGQYIFEVGYNLEAYADMLQDSSVYETLQQLQSTTPYLKSARLVFRVNEIETIDSEEKKAIAQSAVRSGTPTEFSERKSSYIETTLYFPYTFIKDSKSQTWTILAELIYTDELIRKDFFKKLIESFIALFGFSIFIFWIRYYVFKKYLDPLEKLLKGLKEVSNGKLDTMITIDSNNEMALLSHQFNEMTQTIFSLMKEREKHLAQIEKGFFETVQALTQAIEAKDSYTAGHCNQVMKLSVLTARHLKVSDKEIETLIYGSLLHDIGKIGIKDEILQKEGKLSELEYATIKTHPTIGYTILSQIDFLKKATDIVLDHHERIDGRGYPNGKVGSQINYLAKIVTIADSFDAMVSDRAYRHKKSQEEAIKELVDHSGSQFDKEIVEAFISVVMQTEIA